MFHSAQSSTPRSGKTVPSASTQRSAQPASTSHLPPERQPRPQNAPGPIYVDHTCIDCDTCRWMAYSVFDYADGASAVIAQPSTSQERTQSLQALVACPTYSIHATDATPGELAAVGATFPLPVPGTSSVYHLGYHDRKSYGATSYIILRPSEKGNIMIDVPRWNPRLASKIRELGGVKYMFLTHRDDVGDHAKWQQELGCERIIHELEANSRQQTDAVERKLQGEGPWYIDDKDDLEIIFTPGHTAGCISLLYKSERVLFTGDHLAYSRRQGRLSIMRAYNWHSVLSQVESVKALIGLDFIHVLPGHGRRCCFDSVAEKDEALKELAILEKKEGS